MAFDKCAVPAITPEEYRKRHPEITLELTSSPIMVARPRRLRSCWSMEAPARMEHHIGDSVYEELEDFMPQRTLKFKREALLERIKENREKHRSVFEEAVEGYRKKMIEFLTAEIESLKSGSMISHQITIPKPFDRTSDYDNIIEMLEMCQQGEVELTSDEFRCYVRDDWRWKRDFAMQALSNVSSKMSMQYCSNALDQDE